MGGYQGYEETDISDTLNIYDISEGRTPILVVEKQKEPIAFTTEMTPKVDGGGVPSRYGAEITKIHNA